MIENYKGWDITLNWDNKDCLERDSTKNNFFNQKEKWIGVHLNGKKIYGCLLYTSPSPRDTAISRMPSSA